MKAKGTRENNNLKLPVELLSPIRVQSDDKIADCLRQMREDATPAAIALDASGRFEGLFTERDYFKKGHLIEKLMTRQTEIRMSACMDKTVVPVAAQDIHLAHTYMLRTGRRFIPIAASRDDLRTIIGVLSLDELLRFYLTSPIGNGSSGPLSGKKQISLGLVSRDHTLTHQFEALSGDRDQGPRLHVRHIDLGAIVSDRLIRISGESFDGIMIDARSLQPRKWTKLAYSWFKFSQPKRIGILARPERLTGSVPKSLITQMEEHPVFHFFARPRNTLEVAKTTLDFLRVF